MENLELTKTILSVYRYLNRMAMAFDRLVKSKAYNSFYTNSDNFAFNNIENLSDSILNLTERKITLINLKVLTERALKAINKDLAKILIFKFIENKKSDEIANILNVTTRTYFRKVNLAYESFCKALARMGYDEQRLLDMLKNEKWIIKSYEDFKGQQEKKFENESELFIEGVKKNLFFELKKVSQFAS